jgi:ribosomal protein L32
MRATRAHTRNRRSHHALKNPAITEDKDTGTFGMRHRANPTTGKYKGMQIIDVDAKIEKKEAKRKALEQEAEVQS